MAGYKAPSWAGTAPPDNLEKGWTKVGSATDKASAATNRFTSATDKARDASGKFTATEKTAADVMGNSFTASVDKATDALKQMGPEGEAIAEAIQIATAVITAMVVTLYDWAAAAVAVAQKRDAIVATFQALSTGGAGAGEAVLAATTRLAAELPYTISQVNAWAKSLMAAGLQGATMERGVKAIAAATAIMGTEGGAAAENLIKRFGMLAETGAKVKLDRRMLTAMAQAGVSAATLAAQLGVAPEKLSSMAVSADKLGDAFQRALVGKGAGALANVGLTWDSIKAKFDEGITSIFSGLSDAVRPFMEAIKNLFAEFNKGAPSVTVAGGIMKAVLTTVFSWATKVVNALHYGFLVVEVAALKVAIAFAPFVKWLIAIWSNAAVLKGLKIILIGLVAPIAAIVVFLGLVATGIAIVVGGIVTGVSMIAAGFSWIVGQVASFISGIVEGITSGTGAVVGAVSKLASSALAAFKSTLGIHSPSAVMRLQGQYMAAGTVQGLEAGTPSVRAAAAGMAGAGAAGGAQGSGGRGGGGFTVMPGAFAPGSIVIDGAGKSAMQITEEMLTLVLERLAGTQGLVTA